MPVGGRRCGYYTAGRRSCEHCAVGDRPCGHQAIGDCPCRGPWPQPTTPLQVAKLWPVSSARGLAVANHHCRGPGRGRPPSFLVAFVAEMQQERVEQFYVMQSHHTQFETNLSLKNLTLIPLLKTLSGSITCAVEIKKQKVGFPCRSNHYAKDWGREKITKTDKTASCDRLIT
ncbi:hypothetical protein BHE74_00044783 [Ensete ventricosum]|nr:hypothetical protein BHE74_00044783 [Ensete ventricosum]